MPASLDIAGVLLVLLAIAHSVIGERLVFSRLVRNGTWLEAALSIMPLRRWWAVRASWHLVTILGFGLAAVMFAASRGMTEYNLIIGAFVAVAAVYWAIATRLGHPAWGVLGLIAAILFLPL